MLIPPRDCSRPLVTLDHWQPAIPSRKLKSKPQFILLHGQRLVAWRDSQGKATVQPDRCSHRGMSLSHGKVQGDCLVCPYHGWQFDSNGCGTSPGTPKLTINVGVFDTIEQGGVVWVKNAGTASSLPQFEAPGYYPLYFAWADFEAPLELLFDNFTDIEHTGAAHWQFGYPVDRLNEVRLEDSITPDSVSAKAVGPSKSMPWGGRFLLGVKQGDNLTIRYRCNYGPLYIIFDWWWSDPATGAERSGKFREVAFFVPIEPRKSRLVTWYLWTVPPLGRLAYNFWGGLVMRELIKYEIELDRRIIENITPGSTQLEGYHLSRFDRPVVQSRYRLEGRIETSNGLQQPVSQV